MSLKNQLARPNIFEYENYRFFLKDQFAYSKQSLPHFSYRYFSQKAGFSSPNFLKLVTEGKRNLSSQSIERFANAFKLNMSEKEFFESLVYFNQATEEQQKTLWAKKILRCRGFQQIHPLRIAEYSYYAHWYYIPLREMISLKNFKEDPHWLAKQFDPELNPADIQLALEHLQTIGLVERADSGQLRQTQKTVSTGDEVSHSLVKQYHREMIQKGADSIEKVPKSLREVSALCIPLSKIKHDEIKQKIQQFRKEILAIAEASEDADEVYQLNIQWFPLTQPRAVK
jgi:uncharacterized protein (TIGR02147 family)